MHNIDFRDEKIQAFAELMGFGLYEVTLDGEFLYCNSTARKLFGFFKEETDLSKRSIKGLYTVETERALRIDKLKENPGVPLSSSISMTIDGKNKLLFDLCRYIKTFDTDEEKLIGIVCEIENSTIFPKMFDTFPLGLYQLDNNDRIARANDKLAEILKYENKEEMLNKNISNLYNDKGERENFIKILKENGFANEELKFKDKKNDIVEVECFAQNINVNEPARWGMVTNVAERERYKRAIQKMPTGFYQIINDKVIDCNDQFARILGFENRAKTIGWDTTKSFLNQEDVPAYYTALRKADREDRPVQGYEIKMKKADSGAIITISVDSHLIKDSFGKTIGREGTIRDFTEKKELEKQVKETEERYQRTTADINKLIHTFLHPVLKFSANSELLHQISEILKKTISLNVPIRTGKKLGEELLEVITEMRDQLPQINPNISFSDNQKNNNLLAADSLREKLTGIINVFDYTHQTEESSKLYEKAVLDTALWALEEISKTKDSIKEETVSLIKVEQIEYLQGILIGYLVQGSSILMGETKMMRRWVEALRSFIAEKENRKYMLAKRDIGKILEENVQLFKPVFADEEIELKYSSSGALTAEISATDIDRLVANLLQNAKKYSYKGKGRFVRVNAREIQPHNAVEFYVESFGVPIKEEEITSCRIWSFGYRGEMSYSSDRDGTGVGLADVLDVVTAHGGKAEITSEPAGNESNPPTYKIPYKTTVTITIPKKRQGGKRK